jgi:hypothetical protein
MVTYNTLAPIAARRWPCIEKFVHLAAPIYEPSSADNTFVGDPLDKLPFA